MIQKHQRKPSNKPKAKKKSISRQQSVWKPIKKMTLDDLNRSGNTSLHLYAREGNKALVALALRDKADLEARNKEGFTPLHYAAREGQTEIAELILEAKANANTPDHSLRTPLHTAVEANHLDVVQLLFNYKADPTYVLSIFG